MKVMIDTNVILDDFLNREPNAAAARIINQQVADGLIEGYLTASCLTDIYYIVSKKANDIVAKKVVGNLLVSFKIICVDGSDCQKALVSSVTDFEDALVLVCAEKADLDCVIINDKLFLSWTNFNVPIISPSDFILNAKE